MASVPDPISQRRAAFLDRDGVLVEDVSNLLSADQLRLLEGVPGALSRLKQAGLVLIMVTNQPVVARGLATLEEIASIHVRLDGLLKERGGPGLDGDYVCPHHPHADVERWRQACDCRKPRPGLLRKAAEERQLDLTASFMIGDRPTDIAAGAAAGCRTVLVESGHHLDPPIVTLEPLDPDLAPDHRCGGLPEAADWILAQP